MKPYYEHGGITIYHGDCREILPTLTGVDAVVTDPPYGIKACDRSDGGVGSISSGSKFYGRKTWDHQKADPDVVKWICERTAIVWGGNYYEMPASTCWLVWDKMQRDFSFADAELAWTNLPRAVRVFSYSRGQLTQEGKVHPTQKPLPLMKWCLSFLPKDVKTVCDPFAGSFTTLRAVKDAGLNGIGIEIDERNCEIGAERLRQELLFA